MRRKISFQRRLVIILLAASFLVFSIQQGIFHNIHESGFLLLQDLTFLPIHVLFVTLILDQIIKRRERKERIEHQNIVISAFFSEIGTQTLRLLNDVIQNVKGTAFFSDSLNIKSDWEEAKLSAGAQAVKTYAYHASVNARDLARIKEMLMPKKPQIVQLFNNPNLLENDTFTDMIWGLYHLIDELENRKDFSLLPKSDLEHLEKDAERAYGRLLYEWMLYLKYLKKKYPYLWSLAIRKNPFSENESVIVG